MPALHPQTSAQALPYHSSLHGGVGPSGKVASKKDIRGPHSSATFHPVPRASKRASAIPNLDTLVW